MKKLHIFIVFVLVMSGFACASKEEKKIRFFDKGMALFEKESYSSSALEFKNALQIDPKFSEAFYMLGRIEMKKNNFKGAFGLYNKAVQLKPGNTKAHYELGRLYLLAEDTDKASDEAQKILSNDPKNADGLVLQASAKLAKKDYAGASSILDKLIFKGVKRAEIYMMMAKIDIETKEGKGVIDILGEGIRHNSKDMGLHMMLASRYIKDKNSPMAAQTLKKIISLEPDNIQHQFALADFYFNNNDRQNAVGILNGIIREAPDNEDNRILVGKFYFNRKDTGSALQVLEEAPDKKSYKIKLAVAEIQQYLNHTDKAQAILKGIIADHTDPSNPGVVAAKIFLARIHLSKNEIDEALKYVESVIKDNPKNVEARYIKGNILLTKKDGLNAIPEFRTVVAEHPQEMEGYLRLAQAHYMNNEKPLAKDTLKNALKVNPDSREIVKALVELYGEEKETGDAQRLLTDMADSHPKDVRYRMDLADFCWRMKDVKKAMEQYLSIISLAPDTIPTYLKLAKLYGDMAFYSDAEKILDKGIVLQPDNKELLTKKVEILVAQGKFPDAEAICQSNIRSTKMADYYYNLLGRVYAFQKKYPAAEEAFRKSIHLNPGWVSPRNTLAKVYIEQRKTRDAEALLVETLRNNSRNYTAALNLAQLYQGEKAFTKARSIYEKALSDNESLWLFANNLAFLLSEYPESDSDLKKAADMAKLAYKYQADNPVVLDTLGWVHYKLKDLPQADKYIKAALTRDEKNNVIRYHMAMVLFEEGRQSEARENFEYLLNEGGAFPYREDVKRALDQMAGKTAS